MTAFQSGQRVVISFGLHRGKHGEIQQVRDDKGVAVVDVLLDGEHIPVPFRTSILMREESIR